MDVIAGPRLGVVQLIQVRRAPDGPQHGLRAWPGAYPGQLSQSGSHLHQVRYVLIPQCLMHVPRS